jgi:hypothetical protein
LVARRPRCYCTGAAAAWDAATRLKGSQSKEEIHEHDVASIQLARCAGTGSCGGDAGQLQVHGAGGDRLFSQSFRSNEVPPVNSTAIGRDRHHQCGPTVAAMSP